jgi:hypothetical protein
MSGISGLSRDHEKCEVALYPKMEITKNKNLLVRRYIFCRFLNTYPIGMVFSL